MFPPDPHEPRLISWMRNPAVRRTIILVALWLFAAAVLIAFRFVLLPFGLAALLAFVIEPFVSAISERPIFGKRVHRAVAVVGLYLVFGLIVYAFGALALPPLGHEIARIGGEAKNIIANFESTAMEWIDRAADFAAENSLPIQREAIETFARTKMNELGHTLGANAAMLFTFGRSVVASLIQGIFGSFLVLMLTAFLSIDRHHIERFAASLVPPEYAGPYSDIVGGMASGLAGVVRGQLLICLTNGVLTFIGLWLLGVKFPIILATVAMVFSLIPIFGSILSTIPIVAMGLTDGLATGVFALLWIIGIHLLEANFLNPKIMGDAAKIHPVVVVFALIVGERTNGLVGALFAVPIAAIVLTVFKFLHRRAIEAGRIADEIASSRPSPAALPAPPPEPASAASPRPAE